jgi:hypothetical protein
MGLLNHLLGNATQLDKEAIQKEFNDILCHGEEIESVFNIMRDKWVFTTHRLIIEDIQGVTGKKREYHSIPYKSITHFLIETAGSFDSDCEMKIWVSSTAEPFTQEFSRGTNIKEIQRTLASHVLMLK